MGIPSVSVIPFTCAICGAQVHELAGGKCSKCGKIVCRHHFFKGRLKGQNRVCSGCLDRADVAVKESKISK
jgi:hypothetical protein